MKVGNYGTLPMTGMGTLGVGGLAVASPTLAAIAAAAIVGGFLLLRLARPKKIELS